MPAEIDVPILQTRRFSGPAVGPHDLVDLRTVSDDDRRTARAAAAAAVRNLFAALGRDPSVLCSGEDRELTVRRAAAFLARRAADPGLTWTEHLNTWEPDAAERDARDWVQDPREGAVHFMLRRVGDGVIRGTVSFTKIRVVDRQGDTVYVTCQPAPLFTAPNLQNYRDVLQWMLIAGLSANFPAAVGPLVARISAFTFPLGRPEHLWNAVYFPDLLFQLGTVLHDGRFLRYITSDNWPPPQGWVPPPLPPTAP